MNKSYPNTPLFLQGINDVALLAAAQVILSPGVSLSEPAIKQAITAGIPVHGDIELFCREATAPVIAISGSNGKSTVTTLVAEILKNAGRNIAVGGNLGTPALDLLHEHVDVYVLELSSFQLETTFSLNADASVVLNVSPDHMDRYSDIAAYAHAKQKIYSGQGLKVVNKDDELVRLMVTADEQSIGFSLSEPDESDFGLRKLDDELWLCRGEHP